MGRLDRIAEQLDRVVAEHVEGFGIPGAVWGVTSGDERLVGAIGYRPDTIVRVASLTKPIVVRAALGLEGAFSLDDPVERWLPELADRPVLARPDAGLHDVEPARRPHTIRDLLTMGLGLGWHPVLGGDAPIWSAIEAAGLGPGWEPPAMSGDEWLARVGALPAMHQPGEGWLYDSSYVAFGILVARATGEPLERIVSRHLSGLGDTGWWLDEPRVARLAALHTGDGVASPAGDPAALRPPPLSAATTGLYSTVADLLAFGELLLEGGPVVEAMASDQRGVGQVPMSELFLDGEAWGFGLGVRPGGVFGWSGGTGTSHYTSPSLGVSAVLLTQWGFDNPGASDLQRAFVEVLEAGVTPPGARGS